MRPLFLLQVLLNPVFLSKLLTRNKIKFLKVCPPLAGDKGVVPALINLSLRTLRQAQGKPPEGDNKEQKTYNEISPYQ